MNKQTIQKIKAIIYNGLKNIDLSQLDINEQKEANKILEYLEVCLSVKI